MLIFIVSSINLYVLLTVFQFHTVWAWGISISRWCVAVRLLMYFGMWPKLEDSARELNKSMFFIGFFQFATLCFPDAFLIHADSLSALIRLTWKPRFLKTLRWATFFIPLTMSCSGPLLYFVLLFFLLHLLMQFKDWVAWNLMLVLESIKRYGAPWI